MKTDRYTKTVLTIIAICLTVIAFKEVDLIPKAYAGSSENELNSNLTYGLVPLNENGEIDVNIVSSSTKLEVNIEEVGGWWVGGSNLPVKVEE